MATSTLGSGTLVLAGTTSGTTTVTATAVAGTTTLTLPAATDTLVGRATTDTLTNKTLTSPTITGGALNGTVGATTASTGAFTTVSATGFLGALGNASGAGQNVTLKAGFGTAAVAGNLYLGMGRGNSSGTTGNIFFGPSGADANGLTDTYMTLDSSGNLGLGVTPSAWGVYKAIDILSGGAVFGAATNYAGLGSNCFNNGSGWRYKNTAVAGLYQLETNTHVWYTAASGTAGNPISFTQAMTLDGSGNLGVGTTSPTYIANYQNITINGTNGGILDLKYGGTLGGRVSGSSGGMTLETNSAIPIIFYTNNTERARIDSSGNLLVGMTSTTPSNALGFVVNNSNAGISYTQIQHASGTSSGASYEVFYYNASPIGSITQNGTTGVLYNLTSDYRLKNHQQALTGAKDFIMALKPKKWQWWDGSGEGIGFIAHEFMEVAKHSGNGEKDAVDSDGKPVYQSIQPSSSEVMANLISLVQEQQVLITQLTARITALESA